MSLSNTMESDLIKHIFQNANISLIGDATGLLAAGTVGSLYVSLHTSDPGEAGNQTTNESAYTSYARVAVARTAAKWPESGGAASNADPITFPACTGGSSTVTHVGVGTDASGAGKLIGSGALTASLAISAGITPSFAASTLTFTFD